MPVQNEVSTEFTLFEYPVTLQANDGVRGSGSSRIIGMENTEPFEKEISKR